MKSLGSAIALVRSGDWAECARRWTAWRTGRLAPLPKDLAPAPRPAAKERPRRSRAAAEIWMFGPPLRLEGAPISQLELTAGLRDARPWTLKVFASGDGPLRARYEALGLSPRIEAPRPDRTTLPERYEAAVAALAERLRAEAPDLVYVNTLDLFAVVDAARLAGIPSVFNIRESEPWRTRLADRHPKVAARALAAFGYPRKVVFVSELSQQAWSAFDSGAFATIANALRRSPAGDRAAARAALGWGADELVLLCVGTLCERKGQADAVAALAASTIAGRARLVLLGAGGEPYGRALRARVASDPALTGRVDFVEPVTDPSDYYVGADILLCPSRFEAAPRVALEAAAAGLPIVASGVFGLREMFVDGQTALLIPPGDVGALAAAITRLAGDAQMRGKLGAAAAAAHAGEGRYEEMVARYAAAFEDAMALTPADG